MTTRCHCNPEHKRFSSLSNTTVVAIFPKLCLWRRRLSSNLGGISLEKLYRATLRRTLLVIYGSQIILLFLLGNVVLTDLELRDDALVSCKERVLYKWDR